MSTQKAKIYLNNGDVVEITIFGSVKEWVDEVATKGVIGEDFFIPVCSIARISIMEVPEAEYNGFEAVNT